MSWCIEKVNQWDKCGNEACTGYHLLDVCLQLKAKNNCQSNENNPIKSQSSKTGVE